MGTIRIPGGLPNTRPWRKVVALIADGAAAGVVAQATAEASMTWLEKNRNDPGFGRVVFLLAKVILAARTDDFAATLAAHGIVVPTDPSLFDLTAGFTAAVRDWQREARIPHTDLAEMGWAAATESLTAVVGSRATDLYSTPGAVQDAVRALATQAGFATLSHDFFTRLARRYLLYHLDRELPYHVGGNGRFADHAARKAFDADLEAHCGEAATVIRRYAFDWYSKAKFEDEISEPRAKRFASHCLQKLADVLREREVVNG